MANGVLTNLGNVILGASQDYVRRSNALADEERRRQQQLAMLADQRAYSESQRDLQRQLQLEDEGRRRQSSMVDNLINSGVLPYESRDDEGAIQRAISDLQSQSRTQSLAPLIAGGFIDASQASDPNALISGLSAQGEMARSQRVRDDETRTNAMAQLNATANEVDQINQQIREVETQISQLAYPPPPSPEEVRNAAIHLASLDSGGRVANEAEAVRTYGQQARQAIQEESTRLVQLQAQQLASIAQGLRRDRDQAMGRLSGLERLSGSFAPVRPASPPPAPYEPAMEPDMPGMGDLQGIRELTVKRLRQGGTSRLDDQGRQSQGSDGFWQRVLSRLPETPMETGNDAQMEGLNALLRVFTPSYVPETRTPERVRQVNEYDPYSWMRFFEPSYVPDTRTPERAEEVSRFSPYGR